MAINIKSHARGFTLIESLIYAFAMILLVGTMTSFLYYMNNWYQYATISSKVDRLGLTLVDRMVRDIRSGTNVDFSQSSFNTATGWLFINTKVAGIDTTKKISLQNSRLQYSENSSADQYLSPANMSISRLRFISLPNPISQAIRVELQITYTTRSGPVTHDFNGLAIMRQSYD